MHVKSSGFEGATENYVLYSLLSDLKSRQILGHAVCMLVDSLFMP